MKNKIYDIIVVGVGPAALTAGVYAARYKLDTLLIGMELGGMISGAHKVCNFPTYSEITGAELTAKMVEQVKDLGVEIKQEEVLEIKQKKVFEIKTSSGKYLAKKVIIAKGTEKKKLGAKREEEFVGKGVSYCATCDAAFYKDKIVGVVGGSNSALTSALLLTEYVEKVFIFYRQGQFFRAEPAWVSQVEKNSKIEVRFNSEIEEIYGGEFVEGVKLKDGESINLDGLFISVGSLPSEVLSNQLGLRTEAGYIAVDKMQATNVPGVFAAGDTTDNPLKQVVTACAEGAIAANSAFEEIRKEKV